MRDNCTHIRELVSKALDEGAAVKERKTLSDHVRACEECSKYLEIQKILLKEVKKIPTVSAAEIEERLKKIRPGRENEKVTGWIFGPPLKTTLAGIVALLLISTILYVAGKERMKTLSVARNENQIIETLPAEERDLLFFIEETSRQEEEDALEMLQELDEIEELFTDGRAET